MIASVIVAALVNVNGNDTVGVIDAVNKGGTVCTELLERIIAMLTKLIDP